MQQKGIINEIKRNLLGSLEVALFMPIARQRFGDTKDEAIRSFFVPALMFPITLLAVYLYPQEQLSGHSVNMISLMYSLRMIAMWALFFGSIYWLAKEIDRKKHFYQFVIASNWLAVPASVVFIPVLWMVMNGAYSWAELYPFTICLILYTYAFTAFMAYYVMRIPWELAGFVVFIGMCISSSTLDMLYWVSDKL